MLGNRKTGARRVMGDEEGCGQAGGSPCLLGLHGNVPRQRQDGSGEKSLRVDSAGSALWDQAQHQSRATLAKPTSGAHLEQIQPPAGISPHPSDEPLQGRSQGQPQQPPELEIQGYPAHLCLAGNQRCWQREDGGRVGSGGPAG